MFLEILLSIERRAMVAAKGGFVGSAGGQSVKVYYNGQRIYLQ